MKKDIEDRADIYLLVKEFYVKLMNDEMMRHFFLDFAQPDLLEEHLQTLVDFWENILFYTGGYRKNAMAPHLNYIKVSHLGKSILKAGYQVLTLR